MKNIFNNILIIAGLICTHPLAQAQQTNVVTFEFEHAGNDENYYIEKIQLEHNAIPQIELTNIQTSNTTLAATTVLPNSFEPDITLAVGRKIPYAVLRFPKYAKIDNQIQELSAVDLKYTETPNNTPQRRPTYADNSVLNSGTWYKIAVNNRGIYKLDHAFLSSLGINPNQINPNNIRIYGNGGYAMSEEVGNSDNLDDLSENAIFVSTTGSTFGNNDYILFYANGPLKWTYNPTSSEFDHRSNAYEDYSYYFINFDLGPGKRIGSISPNATPTVTVTDFDNYWLSDVDSFSVSNLGKVWWHKLFNTNSSNTLSQSLTTTLYEPAGSVSYETNIGHSNSAIGSFTLTANNNNLFSASLIPLSSEYVYYVATTQNGVFAPGSANVSFTYSYSSSATGKGMMDYLKLNYTSNLKFNGGQLQFRKVSTANLGLNNFAQYRLSNAGSNIQVWDITDPFNTTKIEGTLSGNQYSILAEGNILREFIAFDGSSYLTPAFIETVANQDLHALGYNDLIIITNPDLLNSAEEFANYKRNTFGQSVKVVSTKQIYNEFSSGGQDVVGIRNFIKMFYDRATTADEIPKGFLLYGNASFDFKDRVNNNTNIVPTYQSSASNSNYVAFATDDFFALLDDGENITYESSFNIPILDANIGRLPVNDINEANEYLEKYKTYHSKSSFGPWKNNVSFVADNKDYGSASFPATGMNHLSDCEYANGVFFTENRNFNVHKIYADAYSKEQTSSGTRFPEVNKAINNEILNGTLYMTYNGHGSPQRWAHEAILTTTDFAKWNNLNKLPVIFTGTCDFSRFDNPEEVSSGVKLLKKSNGGAIAMVSTTQIVYQTGNRNMSKSMVEHLFTRNNDGSYNSLGESFRQAKNDNVGSISNSLRFALLGDPTMHLQIPVNQVVTDKITNISTETGIETDTLSALGKYELEGHIQDWDQTLLNNFNGTVYITVYDKAVNLQTLPNETQPTPQYIAQNSALARIIATVENGKFKTQFLIPKDMIYDFGQGKISYYAHSDTEDAKGYDTTFVLGGLDPNAQSNDGAGPIVKPYIDNNKFKEGSVVGSNPLLYVELYDDNGINVSGSSLGHDLVAILDEDESTPFIMNSYYNTYPNDYQNGYVNFQLYNLPEGKHTIKVRAWDIFNNSGEGTVTFEVVNPDKGFIGEVYNYPNPFNSTTNFVVQHNQEGSNLDIKITIYSPQGRMVGYVEKQTLATGNRTEVTWDATTVDGRPLEAGLYFYRLEIHTENGKSAYANQKLVYLP